MDQPMSDDFLVAFFWEQYLRHIVANLERNDVVAFRAYRKARMELDTNRARLYGLVNSEKGQRNAT